MPDYIYHRGARHTIGADRDEEPRAACADNVWAFDELLTKRPNSNDYAYALDAAVKMCAPCPLFVTCEFKVEEAA